MRRGLFLFSKFGALGLIPLALLNVSDGWDWVYVVALIFAAVFNLILPLQRDE